MEYRRLGRSGLQVSALSFGAWVTFGIQVDDDTAYELMSAAYEAGINFFDNAEAYGRGKAETAMGLCLQRAGWKRSDLVLSTKIFWGGEGPNDKGLSRKHILEGTDAALARLQTDYVDLVFCHRPDPDTPIEETVRAMSYLVDQGKAHYWGTSEWSADEIRQAHDVAERRSLVPPTMEQPQYNMLHRERFEKEYAPLFEEFGMGTTIWSPLASGVLTGKYKGGVPEGSRMKLEQYQFLKDDLIDSEKGRANIGKAEELAPLAGELGCTRAQLAIAWCLKNPNVSTVILGASRPEQLVENVASLDVVEKLTPAVMERIEGVLGNES